jgi:hypothetical protein
MTISHKRVPCGIHPAGRCALRRGFRVVDPHPCRGASFLATRTFCRRVRPMQRLCSIPLGRSPGADTRRLSRFPRRLISRRTLNARCSTTTGFTLRCRSRPCRASPRTSHSNTPTTRCASLNTPRLRTRTSSTRGTPSSWSARCSAASACSWITTARGAISFPRFNRYFGAS